MLYNVWPENIFIILYINKPLACDVTPLAFRNSELYEYLEKNLDFKYISSRMLNIKNNLCARASFVSNNTDNFD